MKMTVDATGRRIYIYDSDNRLVDLGKLISIDDKKICLHSYVWGEVTSYKHNDLRIEEQKWGISLDDFLQEVLPLSEEYIVRIAYKYDCEEDYEVSNELLLMENDRGDYIWEHDWWEGQQDVRVLGWIKVSEGKVKEH